MTVLVLLATAMIHTDKAPMWWVTSSLIKVGLQDQPPANPASSINISAQAGELETFQVHLAAQTDDLLMTDAPRLASLGAPSTTHMSWRKVVHVWCNKSSIYPSGSESGWQPDALADASYFTSHSGGLHMLLEAGMVHSFWIRLKVDRRSHAGMQKLKLHLSVSRGTSLLSITVPISLMVWPIVLPHVGSSFGTIFNLFYRTDQDGATQLSKYYGDGPLDPAIKKQYFDLLCESRTPADDPYITDPRPMADYEMLASCGVPRFNLLDVQSVAGRFVNSSMLYTHQQVALVLDILEPLVVRVAAAGLLARAYVYGFDERPRSYSSAIRQLFGAVKARFPQLRTVAVLRWRPLDDMNVDTWINLYSLWNASEAMSFRASAPGREVWAYHCISPRPQGDPPTGPVRFLNTFVEYPAMHPRLLSWWAGLEHVDGWLYYLVDGWEGTDHAGADHHVQPGMGAYSHTPLLLLPRSSSRTNFSAVRHNAVAVPSDPKAFSNGDGILIYPGIKGALASTRLERYRDGLEDVELVRAANALPGGPIAVETIVRTVIHSFRRDGQPGAGVNVTTDTSVLEAARLKLAELISADVHAHDPRNILSGTPIVTSASYQDQPQVVVSADGVWSCVLTANSEREGQPSQSVVSTISTDGGRSFDSMVEIEPHVAPGGRVPLSAGWVNNLLVPKTGRIYAFCARQTQSAP